MTLNQVMRRIKNIALAHKQVRDYREGLLTDFFADSTAKYPACLMQDSGGSISTAAHASTLNFRLFLVDLAHVSSDAKTNVKDVQSDMLSVAMDLIASFNMPVFDDWALSTDNSLQLFDEGENDLHAGCYIDISIRIMFAQNTCQIPTEIINDAPTDTDMKLYDLIYNAPAGSGSSLVIDALKGKKILTIARENNIIYKVSNTPGTTEYTWDDETIGLGTPVGDDGERFLILWRNY